MCGNNGDQSARLELYENFDSANSEAPMMHKIEFSNVKSIGYIEERQKKLILIRMQKDRNFLFYAHSEHSTARWYSYCVLLTKIPKYCIPEIPKEKTALHQDAGLYICFCRYFIV